MKVQNSYKGKNSMRRKISKVLIALMAFGMATATVSAGEINSAEQKLISAVSGSFEYEGKTYVVSSSYIAQGTAKLSEDEVDLSDSDANNYISQFQGSYQELVSEGYCIEVNSEGKKDDNESAKPTTAPTVAPTHSPAVSKVNKQFLELIFGKPEESNSGTDKKSDSDNGFSGAKDNTNDSKGDSGNGQDTTTITDKEEIVWEEEETELGTTLEFDDNDHKNAETGTLIIGSGDNTLSLQADNGKKGSENPQEVGEKEGTYNLISEIICLKQIKIGFIVVAIMSAIAMGWIIFYMMKVKKRHHKKRKLRLGIAIYSGLCLCGLSFLIMVVISIRFGVFNQSAIHRQMMESNYFSGVTQMARERGNAYLQEAGYDTQAAETISSEVFSLSNIYIEQKQYIDKVLSGSDNAVVSTEAINEELAKYITGNKADETKAGMEQIYQEMLQFQVGNVIRKSNIEFSRWFYMITIFGTVFFFLLVSLLSSMYGYLHKAVRVAWVSVFISSAIVTCGSLYAKMTNVVGKTVVSPVYYQQFLQKYIAWDIKVFMYVGCIGILVAVALFIWKRYLHMIYVE